MNWKKIAEVGLGLGLMTGTVVSPIPGDEFIGVPLGVALLAHAFGVLK